VNRKDIQLPETSDQWSNGNRNPPQYPFSYPIAATRRSSNVFSGGWITFRIPRQKTGIINGVPE